MAYFNYLWDVYFCILHQSKYDLLNYMSKEIHIKHPLFSVHEHQSNIKK